jgi:hypothetical protein
MEKEKQKACCEAMLAEMTQQVNTMIAEYCELHLLLTEPKRVLQTTEASEAFSANIQLQPELQLSANIQLQTEHAHG